MVILLFFVDFLCPVSFHFPMHSNFGRISIVLNYSIISFFAAIFFYNSIFTFICSITYSLLFLYSYFFADIKFLPNDRYMLIFLRSSRNYPFERVFPVNYISFLESFLVDMYPSVLFFKISCVFVCGIFIIGTELEIGRYFIIDSF